MLRHNKFLLACLLIFAIPCLPMDEGDTDRNLDTDEENVGEDADARAERKRFLQAQADNGKPQGPSTRFYQFWGHYGEMRAKGSLPFVEEMAQQYGKDGVPFRISLGMKSLYVISDPKDAQLILSGPNKAQFAKGFTSQFLRDYFVGEGIGFLESNDEGFKAVHDALFRFLSERSVRSRYFDLMRAHAHEFAMRLKAQAGRTIDLEEEMTLFTLKIISQSMLNFEITDDAKALELARSFQIALKFIHYRMTNFPFYLPLFVPTHANYDFKKAVKTIDTFIEDAIKHDEDLENTRGPSNSLITYLRRASSEKAGHDDEAELKISRGRFLGQLRNILMAGHDTTKHLLTGIFYQLMENPRVKEKLLQELSEKGDSIREASSLGKMNLPYLDAVIHEALRVNAPVPAVARDVLADVMVRGYLIPKGSIVMIAFDLLHKNSHQWDRPNDFDPDRFLRAPTADSGEKITRHHNSLMPFSTGPRACLGKFFALLEVKATVIALLENGIDFQSVPETTWTPIMACTRRLQDGFKVVVKMNSSQEY